MIDFRYHLVSLISVFLALAVGIVLGAGPLPRTWATSSPARSRLRRAEQLRTEAEQLAGENDQLSSFITEVGPELVDGTLEGRRIAVLTDDDSTRASTERITSLLDAAGVEQTVHVELQSALWEPGREQARTDAVAAAEQIAPGALTAVGRLTDSERLSR